VSEFANKTKLKQATLHNYTKGRPPNAEALFNICKYANININWLLTGEGEKYISQMTHEDKKAGTLNPIEAEHLDVVKQFRDKARAIRIDEKLLELEEISPYAFKRVEGHIQNIIENIKMAVDPISQHGEDRRKGERRKEGSNDNSEKGEIEKRTGQDRRIEGI
jgi:transcriptional regulator with XRE-family HTH domain